MRGLNVPAWLIRNRSTEEVWRPEAMEGSSALTNEEAVVDDARKALWTRVVLDAASAS